MTPGELRHLLVSLPPTEGLRCILDGREVTIVGHSLQYPQETRPTGVVIPTGTPILTLHMREAHTSRL